MITQSSNADITDGSLELDKRVSLVVRVRWASFTAGTEVSVVADSALVAVSLDVAMMAISVAEWSVAVDAVVARLAAE